MGKRGTLWGKAYCLLPCRCDQWMNIMLYSLLHNINTIQNLNKLHNLQNLHKIKQSSQHNTTEQKRIEENRRELNRTELRITQHITTTNVSCTKSFSFIFYNNLKYIGFHYKNPYPVKTTHPKWTSYKIKWIISPNNNTFLDGFWAHIHIYPQKYTNIHKNLHIQNTHKHSHT